MRSECERACGALLSHGMLTLACEEKSPSSRPSHGGIELVEDRETSGITLAQPEKPEEPEGLLIR